MQSVREDGREEALAFEVLGEFGLLGLLGFVVVAIGLPGEVEEVALVGKFAW